MSPVPVLVMWHVTCVQVKELEEVLGGRDGDSQIIWTSSQNAKKEAFSLDDIQHEHGCVVSGLNTLNMSSGVSSLLLHIGLIFTIRHQFRQTNRWSVKQIGLWSAILWSL